VAASGRSRHSLEKILNDAGLVSCFTFIASACWPRHGSCTWLAYWNTAGANIYMSGSSLFLTSKMVVVLVPQASIDIIVANVDDPESLLKMAKQTRLVLNCVGPYRYW
jgi:hypothetical protein